MKLRKQFTKKYKGTPWKGKPGKKYDTTRSKSYNRRITR